MRIPTVSKGQKRTVLQLTQVHTRILFKRTKGFHDEIWVQEIFSFDREIIASFDVKILILGENCDCSNVGIVPAIRIAELSYKYEISTSVIDTEFEI